MPPELAEPHWQRHLLLRSGCVLFVLVAAARIVSTYSVFNATTDEPAHIAAGMEWLEKGRYRYEPQHPPLQRVAVALGPYLDGARSQGETELWAEGDAILEARGQYARTLALARLGTLPFFITAAFIVWLWARRLSGESAGCAAVGLLTMLPTMLAHGGLATTDMSSAATVPAAVLAFACWLKCRTATRSAVLGLACAAAVLSKLSAIPFLAASFPALFICQFLIRGRDGGAPPGPRQLHVVPAVLIAAVAAFGLIWAGYRFSIAYPHRLGSGRIPFPAMELILGLRQAYHHNAEGHPAFLLGRLSQTGWWYFFPVALLVKTPIPFLCLAGVGSVATARCAYRDGDWERSAPILAALAIMAAAMTARINIGVRHVLPMYPLLAIPAGYAVAGAWNAARHRTLRCVSVVGLLGWLVGTSVAIHPDYLAYFNEFAGRRPERILVDSDLDWGQDYFRLVEEVKTRELDTVWVAYGASLDQERHALPSMHPLAAYTCVRGWIAAGQMALNGVWGGGYLWLNRYPRVARVGRSIWLLYVPDTASCAEMTALPARPPARHRARSPVASVPLAAVRRVPPLGELPREHGPPRPTRSGAGPNSQRGGSSPSIYGRRSAYGRRLREGPLRGST